MPTISKVKVRQKSERQSTEVLALEALTYREPMKIERITRYASGACHAICPRCNIPVDRDFQAYCDRCGQHLNWRGFSKIPVKGWNEL